jgi:hypothetical protein
MFCTHTLIRFLNTTVDDEFPAHEHVLITGLLHKGHIFYHFKSFCEGLFIFLYEFAPLKSARKHDEVKIAIAFLLFMIRG